MADSDDPCDDCSVENLGKWTKTKEKDDDKD